MRRGLRALTGRVWPIRAYLILLLVLFVAAAAGSFTYVQIQTRRDAERSARHDTGYAATIAAKQLASYVNVLGASVRGLAANPQIERSLASPAGCTLTFAGIGGPDRSHLDVIASDGRVACSSRRQSGASPFRYPDADWLRRARRGFVFAAPVTDAATGAPMAVAAAPTTAGHAVIAGFMDLSTTGPTLASLYGGGHPIVFLVTSRDGRTVIVRSRDAARWIGKPLAGTPFATSGGSTHTDLDGVQRLFTQTSVPGTGWRFYAGESEHDVLQAGQRLERRQLLVIGVGLLVALLGTWFVQRRLAQPIRRLAGSLGGADGEARPDDVPVGGPTELVELGQTIKRLMRAVDRELHERRRAEAAIAESERSYRLLFQTNPNPMWVFDAETLRFLAVNDAALNVYGYSREEFLAMTIEDIRPQEELAALHEITSNRDRSGLRTSGIWHHLRKDGTTLDVEVTSHDHVFEGRPARVVVAVDVTERLRAEAALRSSEARYRDLFENATDLIAASDLEGRLTAVNRRFAETLGYEPAELIGRPLVELVPPEWHEAMAAARARTDDDPAAVTVYEQELLARDGLRIPVEVATRAITDHGRPVGLQAICRDVAERRSLEEQLRQSQRLEAVGQLAGGVAHDFNNILTVISGYAETLLEEAPPGSERELREIAAAAERAAILTRQLLAFSRRQLLQPRLVDLNAVVDGVVPMLARLIGEDIELVTTLDPSVQPVLADPTQLEQVLVNLVVNARDAMPGGGQLTIETGAVQLDEDYAAHHAEATTGPHTLLAVSDNGIGMDAETTSRIFEPFFTTKPTGMGTGLGLASVYGTVKQSGGSIWVYSEPGHGTTFKIYLPAEVSDAPLDDAAPVEEPPAPAGSETVLVAEDEPSLRALVEKLLTAKGYTVIAARNVDEAVDAAEREPVDLLLTDLIMPRMNGPELAERVRALRPGIAVLYMSGYADAALARNDALELGAFLEKPFSAAELARRVRETLDGRDSVPA